MNAQKLQQNFPSFFRLKINFQLFKTINTLLLANEALGRLDLEDEETESGFVMAL